MKGQIGVNDILVHWRTNISPVQRFTIQPMLYARLLIGGDIPLGYRNAVGSEWFGQQVEQQLPFAGIGNLEYMNRYIAAAQLQLQLNILKNHYVILRATAATHSDDLMELALQPAITGMQIGYSYNTLFGPVDLRLGYSNRTKKINLFLNIGHRF